MPGWAELSDSLLDTRGVEAGPTSGAMGAQGLQAGGIFLGELHVTRVPRDRAPAPALLPPSCPWASCCPLLLEGRTMPAPGRTCVSSNDVATG